MGLQQHGSSTTYGKKTGYEAAILSRFGAKGALCIGAQDNVAKGYRQE
jgi:hypothetical protein